jgi:hypothetical protein
MPSSDAADEIRWVIRRELADCQRAIEHKDLEAAQVSVDEAIRKLKRIADDLD